MPSSQECQRDHKRSRPGGDRPLARPPTCRASAPHLPSNQTSTPSPSPACSRASDADSVTAGAASGGPC